MYLPRVVLIPYQGRSKSRRTPFGIWDYWRSLRFHYPIYWRLIWDSDDTVHDSNSTVGLGQVDSPVGSQDHVIQLETTSIYTVRMTHFSQQNPWEDRSFTKRRMVTSGMSDPEFLVYI